MRSPARLSTFRSIALMLLSVLAGVPALAADPVVTLKFATVAPDGSPWAQKLQEFKKVAEERAGGKLKVKLFLGGALGDEQDTVLAAKRGQIHAVGASTGALASQVPELNVLEIPYLFHSYEEADYVLDQVIRADVEKYCADRGLVFLFWSENGFRSFGGRFKIERPEDLKGRKMRSQETPIHLAMYRAFGASPTPIPATEALTALQTGNVEGYDQAPLYLFAASWHTATTHIALTEHIYQPAAIVVHKASWDAWPPEVQEAVRTAGASVEKELRTLIRAMNPILVKNLRAAGIHVHEPSSAEKAAFARAVSSSRAEAMKSASKGEKALLARIEKALAERRKATK